jgi:hypothetical protein
MAEHSMMAAMHEKQDDERDRENDCAIAHGVGHIAVLAPGDRKEVTEVITDLGDHGNPSGKVLESLAQS